MDQIELREVIPGDLPIFYEQQRDSLANQMAAFPARDRPAFDAHWVKILADPSSVIRTIEYAGQVAGNVLSFVMEGKREVGYWLGREYWGKGIATRALRVFLEQYPTRPLYAHVVQHNQGSIRVLEKCGFERVGEDRSPFWEGEQEIAEWVYILE